MSSEHTPPILVKMYFCSKCGAFKPHQFDIIHLKGSGVLSVYCRGVVNEVTYNLFSIGKEIK